MYPSSLHRVICVNYQKLHCQWSISINEKTRKVLSYLTEKELAFWKGIFLKIAERLEKLTFVAIISRGWWNIQGDSLECWSSRTRSRRYVGVDEPTRTLRDATVARYYAVHHGRNTFRTITMWTLVWMASRRK